ncbi:MAG: cytochrome c biogenesis protein ResB, partial [Bdellovibrio sp.]|nr:cytochrome c biogenesis protein ResB [Bdellovibrio sp.]
FCVALSRLPWKKKHIPFLLAHVGILTLLGGSWVTERAGIDGNLRFSEGENASWVDLDSNYFLVADEDQNLHRTYVPWVPPQIPFRGLPVEIPSKMGVPFKLKIDQYLTHADAVYFFLPENEESSPANLKKHPAVKLKITGGLMQISQEIWLWSGSPEWSRVQAGPAQFALGQAAQQEFLGPSLVLKPLSNGGLEFEALGSENASGGKRKKVGGRLGPGQIKGRVITPGWRGDVKITIEDWVPHARPQTTYKPARVQYGQAAPSSAIHLTAEAAPLSKKGTQPAPLVDMWLGLGDRALLHLSPTSGASTEVKPRVLEIGYFPKRIFLPFSVRLDRFSIEHDQGTVNPASYSSRVTVTDSQGQKDVLISMNEPLEHRGFTLYQASYEDAEPRPVTSILTVNQDPGRWAKYSGSFLIVLGSVLLFVMKLKNARALRRVTLEVS